VGRRLGIPVIYALFKPGNSEAARSGGAGPAAGLKAAARRYVEIERNWPGSVARYRNIYAALVPQLAQL
jgi:hypothetical protein